MSRVFRARLGAFLVLTLSTARLASAQSPAAGGAPLREVHAEGAKILTEAQIVSLAGLQPGSQVGKDDLQAAADRLIQSGLFAKVNFNFLTRGGGVFVTYHVEESPRLPVYFDNIPWFADSELADAIRKTFPYFDGTLPEAGAAVDRAGDAVKELLSSHGLQAAVEHAVIPNPVGEGNVQEFRIEGAPPQIATVEFSDPSLLASKAVQQHLSEIRGKAYSRMAIDLFLTEAIRPVYLQQGYLRVKSGKLSYLITAVSQSSPIVGRHKVHSADVCAVDRGACRGPGDAADVVAADDALWTTHFVAVLRFSCLGAVFGLPACAAGVGLRSVCQLWPLRPESQ